jgi:uncharacterized membrane protein YGL010W
MKRKSVLESEENLELRHKAFYLAVNLLGGLAVMTMLAILVYVASFL